MHEQMNVLRQIYDGDYYSSEQIVPSSPEYREKRAACNASQDRLEQALGADKESLLTEFLDRYAEIVDLMQYEFFREGVRLGLSLAQELRDEQGCEVCPQN